MKGLRNLVVAGCSVLLLSQCASQDEVRKLNYQIRTVNQKVEEVKSSTTNQMQKGQASSVNRIDAVSSETQQLRALVEESGQKSSQLREQTKVDLAALASTVEQMRMENEQRIKALEARMDQVSGSLDRVQKARVEAAEQRAREAARRAEEAIHATLIWRRRSALTRREARRSGSSTGGLENALADLWVNQLQHEAASSLPRPSLLISPRLGDGVNGQSGRVVEWVGRLC